MLISVYLTDWSQPCVCCEIFVVLYLESPIRGMHSHLLCLAHKTLRIHRMPSLNRVLFTVTVKFTQIKLLKKSICLLNQKTTFIQHAVQLTDFVHYTKFTQTS